MSVGRVWSWEHDSEGVAAGERHAAWWMIGKAVSMVPTEAASHVDPVTSARWQLQLLQLSVLASMAMLQ